MSKYRDIAERINYALFLAVVFLLPFPQLPLRYAYVLWLVSWLFEARWLKIQNLKSQISNLKSLIPFLLFALWYAWRLLSGLWAADTAAWAAQMERYLSFAVILPLALWGLNERYDRQQIGRVWVYGCLAALVYYPALLTVFYVHPQWIAASPWAASWDYSASEWLPFYQNNISVFKHRLYLCSVEVMGMVMATLVWRQRRALWLTLLALMTGGCILTGSRQIILTLAILAAVALILYLPQRQRRLYGTVILLLSLALGIGVLSLQPRMYGFNIHYESRTLIWKQAVNQPSDYCLTGLGAGQSGAYLKERYRETGSEEFLLKAYNAHNQYLEEWMELGVFGLLLFLCAWLSIPICANEKRRRTAVLFMLLFMLNMCTECMFGIFCGVALWAAGMVYLFLASHAEGEQVVHAEIPNHHASDSD